MRNNEKIFSSTVPQMIKMHSGEFYEPDCLSKICIILAGENLHPNITQKVKNWTKINIKIRVKLQENMHGAQES